MEYSTYATIDKLGDFEFKIQLPEELQASYPWMQTTKYL